MSTLLLTYFFLHICRLQVWSFNQLTKMVVAQVQDKNSENAHQFPFSAQSSSPLHDLFATAVASSGQCSLSSNRSFQVGLGHANQNKSLVQLLIYCKGSFLPKVKPANELSRSTRINFNETFQSVDLQSELRCSTLE